MKKLIQAKDYLLLIDEEAEIKGTPCLCYNSIKNTWSDDVVLYQGSLPKYHYKGFQKIIAHYPLTEEAKELDLPLLPPFEDVDIEKEALDIPELKNKWEHLYTFGYPNKPYPTGFQHDLDMIMLGLYESKSKQFSLEDMKKAIEMAQSVKDYGNYKPYSEEEIIQSLSTQQLPKEFIPEYECLKCLECEGAGWMLSCSKCKGEGSEKTSKLKTITNSEGKEELVGTYKY